MDKYKIEKGIPIVSCIGYRSKYPFTKMEVGDSVLIKKIKISSIYIAASYYGKKLHKKFACRKQEGGVRVWRLE